MIQKKSICYSGKLHIHVPVNLKFIFNWKILNLMFILKNVVFSISNKEKLCITSKAKNKMLSVSSWMLDETLNICKIQISDAVYILYQNWIYHS